MNVVVRPAVSEDAVQLHRLILAHAVFERGAASLTLPALEALLGADTAPLLFLVGESAARLVGYASVTFDWSTWRGCRYAHLDCLFVDDGMRGLGVGKLLFLAARHSARERGVDCMEWQTPAWNEAAARFYVREGGSFQPKLRFSMPVT